MVRVVRLERTVSWSQTRRDTNFAIPGYSLFCHDTTARGKNKVFSVCGQSCGQSHFCAAFSNRGKSRKCRRRKALRRFTLPRPGYRHGAPKAGALPTAQHPVMKLGDPAGRILPNHPRYQLRYTRIFSFCHYNTARGEKQSFFSLRSFMCAIHIGQVKKAMRDMVSCDKAELPHQLIRKRDHIPHGQENNTGHGISAIPDEEHGELRLRVRQPVYPDYFTFRAAFSWSTRSVRSQVTPRSSRPMCP